MVGMALAGWLRPAAALAHPLDVLFHDMRVQVQPTRLALSVHLVAGPLVTPRLWDDLDRDGSGTLDEAEVAAWCARFDDQIEIRLDGAPLILAIDSIEPFPSIKADFIGAAAINLEWSAVAGLGAQPAAGDHTLSLRSPAYADISAVDWSKTRGRDGIVVREATLAAGDEASFPIVWPAAFKAENGLELPASAESTPQVPASAANPDLLERLKAGDTSWGLLVGTLGMALLFGALHALQPGHGKTLVAAYLIGSRGTVRQAVVLGGIVTFTHTASVFIFGTLILALSAWVSPQRIIPGLTVFSGLLVVAVGLRLLLERGRAARSGAATHDHGDGLLHDHGPGADHQHGGGLISLGVSGGLVPCPEALAIMIAAAIIGRLGLGLAMIVAFSAGLAGVLITLGIVLVTVGRHTWNAARRPSALARWLPVGSAALVVGLGAALAWQGLATIL
jgi:ABC-type nickel/cobalt efflux system permease component RcnA